MSVCSSQQRVDPMQTSVLMQKDFYKEISFLPAAAVNSWKFSRQLALKVKRKSHPGFQLPGSFQWAQLQGETACVSGVANTRHLCPGFGRGMQVLVWETLVCSCFYRGISNGVPSWGLAKPFGEPIAVVSQRIYLDYSKGNLFTAGIKKTETHDIALWVFTKPEK